MAKLSYPKQPKLTKYRRKPKASASNATLEKYLHHVKEVDAKNRQKMAEFVAAKKRIDAEKKKAEKLKKAVASVGVAKISTRKPAKRKTATKKAATKRKPAKKAASKTAKRRK